MNPSNAPLRKSLKVESDVPTCQIPNTNTYFKHVRPHHDLRKVAQSALHLHICGSPKLSITGLREEQMRMVAVIGTIVESGHVIELGCTRVSVNVASVGCCCQDVHAVKHCG